MTHELSARLSTIERCWKTAIANVTYWRNEATVCRRAGYEFGFDRANRNAREANASCVELCHTYYALEHSIEAALLASVKCGDAVKFVRSLASRAVHYEGAVVGFVNHLDGRRSARVQYIQKNGRSRTATVSPLSFEDLDQ